MTDRDDGPWDAPTEHAPPRDTGAKPIASTTLPPPSASRQPAQSAPLVRVSAHAPTEHPPPRAGAAASVVIVASGADADRARELCRDHALLVPVMSSLDAIDGATSAVVLGEPSPPAPDGVAFVVRPSIPGDQLVALVRAVASGHAIVEPPPAPAATDARLADVARRLGSITDRASLETLVLGAVTALTDADRAHCLFHDPATGALWSEARRRAGTDDRRATGGLVGWAARTGHAIHASPAGDDPRWLQELDDPDGKPQSRLLVQPVIGADRRVHAVLVAVRRWSRTDVGERETKALATFAALVGPALDRVVAASAAPSRAPRTTRPGPLGAASKSALVAAPRTASDSRPPPLTARLGTSPPSAPGARATPVPFSDERTRLDPPPEERSERDANPAPRARVDDVSSSERDAVPPALLPRIDDHTRVDDRNEPAERFSSDSILSLPTPPSIPRRAATPPLALRTAPAPFVEPALPSLVAAADVRSGPVRARRASDSKRPRVASEPRDLAVVADADDAKRVHKIAKKARLELATFSQLADAPDFYQVVTIGGTFSPEHDRRIAYAARSTISDDQLADLLVALTGGRALDPPPPLPRAQTTAEARRLQVALAGARKLAALSDLAAAEDLATATLRELLDCDRAYCWFVDPETGALWSEMRRRAGTDDRRAIAGIAGWVARTGRAAAAPHASTDPRWLGPLDDPDGDPHSQLLVQPLTRADERVHGVLIAVRRARRPGFTESDAALLARFAALAAPVLEHVALHVDTRALAGEDAAAFAPTSTRAPAPVLAAPVWLSVLRGQHALSRWIFLALGVIVGLVIGLLA